MALDVTSFANAAGGWHREEAGFAQRMVVTIAAECNRLNAQGTMSRDGGLWENDLQLTYEDRWGILRSQPLTVVTRGPCWRWR